MGKKNIIAFTLLLVIIVMSMYIGYTYKYVKHITKGDYKVLSRNLANELEYDWDNFNCVQFSEELVRRLELIGKNAEIVDGYTKYPHVWVKCHDCDDKLVYIESTSGKVIGEEEYKNDYFED